jgi:hypothetical protein
MSFVRPCDVEDHIAFVLGVLVYGRINMVLRHVTHSSYYDDPSAAADADNKEADSKDSPRNIHVFN